MAYWRGTGREGRGRGGRKGGWFKMEGESRLVVCIPWLPGLALPFWGQSTAPLVVLELRHDGRSMSRGSGHMASPVSTPWLWLLLNLLFIGCKIWRKKFCTHSIKDFWGDALWNYGNDFITCPLEVYFFNRCILLWMVWTLWNVKLIGKMAHHKVKRSCSWQYGAVDSVVRVVLYLFSKSNLVLILKKKSKNVKQINSLFSRDVTYSIYIK